MAESSPTQQATLTPEPLGLEPSFGFGDRLGSATPGHLAALREAGGAIRGIFAQQSIREMTRTSRTADEVMSCAVDALAAESFADKWGADADHLKTEDDVRNTMASGFVFFTLDPSGDVDQEADNYNASQLAEKFAAAREWAPWFDSYLGQTVQLDSTTIEFNQDILSRAAVKYGKSIQATIKLAKFVESEAERLGKPFELELSVDETAQPTTAAEHYLIADQLRQAGVKLVSLAPRFVGDFEKGVDFKGDLTELEKSLQVHAEIAERMGPYKLSLHSGSDKLAMYPLLARTTKGRFHVKTAGTSYLEALRVAAHKDPAFFREIVDFSRARYDDDKATYHVSAEVDQLPVSADLNDTQVEVVYLERWCDVPAGKGFTNPGRQVLHCTFGSVVTDPNLGPRLKALLESHADVYTEVLRDHFVRHLQALR
ncbi:tagaturonate epimerase family protein [Aeoliella sp. ICT_H6.2]|uniref:Tagaturonate epimerase family protein n=1 Tax=Aeoliella straminimaris TaxID=2954799 RepID=A0A9X2FC76_9BACT|nr:tagaturonate epimerase family protein [Aeoliella straminimaris]MCO6046265.1 tagaturonate epimerase family protein [Aeoliella straminimaris]